MELSRRVSLPSAQSTSLAAVALTGRVSSPTAQSTSPASVTPSGRVSLSSRAGGSTEGSRPVMPEFQEAARCAVATAVHSPPTRPSILPPRPPRVASSSAL
eukprot:7594904-Pyramimonas_sp.AAC.1